MSTRCVINFCHGKRVVAKIYRHHDGYPDTDGGVLADLTKFVTTVEAQTNDTRFSDPSYLAAKFVVWQADQNSRVYDSKTGAYKPGKQLEFLGVGILTEDPGDIDFRYFLDCSNLVNGKPTVTYEKYAENW